MRLIATTNDASASAGNIDGHHTSLSKLVRSSKIVRPQSGEPGCEPKPMKARPAIVKTAYPRRTVNSTMIGPKTLGRISTNIV